MNCYEKYRFGYVECFSEDGYYLDNQVSIEGVKSFTYDIYNDQEELVGSIQYIIINEDFDTTNECLKASLIKNEPILNDLYSPEDNRIEDCLILKEMDIEKEYKGKGIVPLAIEESSLFLMQEEQLKTVWINPKIALNVDIPESFKRM